MTLNKLKFLFVLIVFSLNIGSCFAQAIEENKLKTEVEVSFFADQTNLNLEDRKNIVEFMKFHNEKDFYEFEIRSLSDPLHLDLDLKRLLSVQGLFREHDIQIDKLINARVRFISGNDQVIKIIRKVNDHEK